MRRVQISNLPLYMGLTEKDVMQIVSKFLIDNYLNDDGNMKPVLSTTLNHQGNFAVMEISSVEEANRLIKIESIILLKIYLFFPLLYWFIFDIQIINLCYNSLISQFYAYCLIIMKKLIYIVVL